MFLCVTKSFYPIWENYWLDSCSPGCSLDQSWTSCIQWLYKLFCWNYYCWGIWRSWMGANDHETVTLMVTCQWSAWVDQWTILWESQLYHTFLTTRLQVTPKPCHQSETTGTIIHWSMVYVASPHSNATGEILCLVLWC